MPYHSIDEILRRCRDRACPFWQVVLTTQAKEAQVPESAVLDQMDQMAKAMEDSVHPVRPDSGDHRQNGRPKRRPAGGI